MNNENLDQATRVNPKPLCACRCGAYTNTPHASFIPGHDARLVSVALRDLLGRIRRAEGHVSKELYDRWTTELAVDRFGDRYALRAKFNRAADRQWLRVNKTVRPR